MQKELIYDSLTFVRGVYACQTNKLFCKHLGVPWESLYHAYVRIFCSMHQEIVQCWLKQVKKGNVVIVDVAQYVDSSNFSSEFPTKTGSPNRERARLTRNVMDREQTIPSEWQANMRVSGESVRGEGKEELSFSFPAPCSHVLFCVPLARDFSRYPLNGELTRRLLRLRFSLL